MIRCIDRNEELIEQSGGQFPICINAGVKPMSNAGGAI